MLSYNEPYYNENPIIRTLKYEKIFHKFNSFFIVSNELGYTELLIIMEPYFEKKPGYNRFFGKCSLGKSEQFLSILF